MKRRLCAIFFLFLVQGNLYSQGKSGFRISANSVHQKRHMDNALDSMDIIVVSLFDMDTLIFEKVRPEYKGHVPEGRYKLIASHQDFATIEKEFIVLDNKVTFLTLNFKHGKGPIGTWKLKTVLDKSGKKCSSIKKYELEMNVDNSYYILFEGTSWAEGTWTIDAGMIKFDTKTVSDPCMEWTFDEEFKPFVLTEDDVLIIDIFICGTAEGRSYFKRKH